MASRRGKQHCPWAAGRRSATSAQNATLVEEVGLLVRQQAASSAVRPAATPSQKSTLRPAVGLQQSSSISVVGFSLAMLLREKFRGSGIVTTLILVPMMLSPVVVGLFWRLIFDPSKGIFNHLIYIDPTSGEQWLANPTLALWAIIIVGIMMPSATPN